jgi:hypothetical protein
MKRKFNLNHGSGTSNGCTAMNPSPNSRFWKQGAPCEDEIVTKVQETSPLLTYIHSVTCYTHLSWRWNVSYLSRYTALNRDYRTWPINWFTGAVLRTGLLESFSLLPRPAGPWGYPTGRWGSLPRGEVAKAPCLMTRLKMRFEVFAKVKMSVLGLMGWNAVWTCR